MNSSSKKSIMFSVDGCNKLTLPLLQKLVHHLSVLLYFYFVASLHTAGISACASYEIDFVSDTGSLLVGPSFKVSGGLDVSCWFQEVLYTDLK